MGGDDLQNEASEIQILILHLHGFPWDSIYLSVTTCDRGDFQTFFKASKPFLTCTGYMARQYIIY
jgi:hypothetical protein